MYTNPYSPPVAPVSPAYGYATPKYVPVGWRATAAALAIGGTVLFAALGDLAQLALADRLAGDGALGANLVVGALGIAALGTQLLAIVFFCMFLHRAATNLRAFGREGMEYTPGWCVGWFFVPFANLFRPFRATREVWRASDPDAVTPTDWMTGTTPSLLSLWWGTWLVSNVIANVSARMEGSASASIGLFGDVLAAGAAAACIAFMTRLGARQSTLAMRVTSPAQVYGYPR